MANALKENPELLSQLESQIREISGAVRRLLSGPVSRRAILVLLNDSIPNTKGIGISSINEVLSAVEKLDTQYLKKKIAQK